MYKYVKASEQATSTYIDTAYSNTHDMTFILKETVDADGEPLSTEVVGFYYGSPNEADTQKFTGELKAEYTMGR